MSTTKELIDNSLDKWDAVLKAFPRGPMGLTPDEVKATAQWKEARRQYDYWFSQLRTYNKTFLKTHKHVGYEIVNGKRISLYKQIL